MNIFHLTKKAKEDLRSIALYTQNRWGREQRNLYIKQFDESFILLSNAPQLGKACDDIKAKYRKFPQGSHIIFYKEADVSEMLVIRILHKNMDIDSKFD